MASITLTNVSKRFGPKLTIPGISLAVADGEFLVLLGPSGCGKSTLLRMLAGLETVSGGEIRLCDQRVDQLPPSGRDMAFVFQSYERSSDVAGLVERTARTLSLTEALDRHPRTPSGGQRQRVALGRAMVRQPEVFLMDELLSNLDAKLRTAMRGQITRLHGRVGGTFVYVTPDQVEAMTMGMRIALMRDGQVQQFGTPRESTPTRPTFRRPVHRHAGNEPDRSGDGGRGGPDWWRGAALAAGACRAGVRAPVLVGIQPGALTLTAPGVTATVPGRVNLVEHIGAESVVAVRLDGVRTAHDEEGVVSGEVVVTVPGYSGLK